MGKLSMPGTSTLNIFQLGLAFMLVFTAFISANYIQVRGRQPPGQEPRGA